MRRFIAIDPGLRGTGYAIWGTNPKVPIKTGVVFAPGSGDMWIDRCHHIADDLYRLVFQHQVREIVCEMMEFHGTAKSAMSWHGDLQRTLILIGIILGRCEAQVPQRIRLTPPSEWKGQLPKSITIARVTECLGRATCAKLGIKTHAWDAVGIGLWHRGYIK